METIGEQLLRSYGSSGEIETLSCNDIRNSPALIVVDYKDLARRIAELQFLNRDFVILFRGQDADYRNSSDRTTIRPTLLRMKDPKKVPGPETVAKRFQKLKAANAGW